MDLRKQQPQIRQVENEEYLGVLKELILAGKEVNLLVSGSSMSPFIIHQRDTVRLAPLSEPVKKGMIVFFQREDGSYILHRVLRKSGADTFDIIGDGQTYIEKNVKREQIFAVVTAVCRKGVWIRPGDFWWEFFEHIWLHMIQLRMFIRSCYGKV